MLRALRMTMIRMRSCERCWWPHVTYEYSVLWSIYSIYSPRNNGSTSKQNGNKQEYDKLKRKKVTTLPL